jgi:hypothetical protein
MLYIMSMNNGPSKESSERWGLTPRKIVAQRRQALQDYTERNAAMMPEGEHDRRESYENVAYTPPGDAWHRNRAARLEQRAEDRRTAKRWGIRLVAAGVILGGGAVYHWNSNAGNVNPETLPPKGERAIASAPASGVGEAACRVLVVNKFADGQPFTIDTLRQEIDDTNPEFDQDTLKLNPNIDANRLVPGMELNLGQAACNMLVNSVDAELIRQLPKSPA